MVLPEYEVIEATAERTPTGWQAAATVRNVGTGTALVEIAALGHAPGSQLGSNGEPIERRESRSLRLAPGRAVPVEWTLDFQPERIVVDPEALILQLNRERAVAVLDASPASANP